MIQSISAGVDQMLGTLLGTALNRLPASKSESAVPTVSPVAPQPGKDELTDEELQQIEELEQRDREVKQHESAHQAAAGDLASGGIQFEYETGPDGKRYAVGGHVNIDTSTVKGDPEATIRKMEKIQRAANAPGDPSAEDRRVAAQAAAAEQQARAESSGQPASSTTSTSSSQLQSYTALGGLETLGDNAPGATGATGRFIDVRV